MNGSAFLTAGSSNDAVSTGVLEKSTAFLVIRSVEVK